MMGETGQGCKSEEEVKERENPNLTRTWGEYPIPLPCGRQVKPFAEEVKKKCPWYFTLKGLISERPNLTPVGLGNNAANYDTSILLNHENNQMDSSDGEADESNSDETKTTKNQENEGDPTSNAKPAAKGKKVTIKKEGVVPSKRTRSQIDRIADTEVARYECKKAKFDSDQQRARMLVNVASAKAEAKSRTSVEIRQAELNLERERMKLDHEYRMATLKYHGVLPSSSQGGVQFYPTSWQSPPPFDPQRFSSSQPSSGSQLVPGSGSQQFGTSSQPLDSFEVPTLDSFAYQTSGQSDSEHRSSPSPGPNSFGKSHF
jgi:hypothetical protein